MAKLDWRRVDERESFDARVGLDWRKGPTEASIAPGLLPLVKWDVRDPPNVHWAAEMAARLGYDADVDGARQAVEDHAAKVATQICSHGGINAILRRTPQFYKRSSRLHPFPSAYFAICFDFAGMRIALDPRARHGEKPARKLTNFYSSRVMQDRVWIHRKAFGDDAEFTGITLKLTVPGEPGRRLIFEGLSKALGK